MRTRSVLTASNVSWRCNHSIMAAIHTGLFTLITLQIFVPSQILPSSPFSFKSKFERSKRSYTLLLLCVVIFLYSMHACISHMAWDWIIDVNIPWVYAYWSNIKLAVGITTGLVRKIWQSLLLTGRPSTLTIRFCWTWNIK